MNDVKEDTSVVLSNVGWFTLSELDGEDTQRPDINLVRVLLVFLGFDELWSHPAHGSDFTGSALLLLSEHNCITEIRQFDLTIFLAENIV